MIRLGGNSLAAFRGCGVAGTVQSVAGCELFGAARGTSPYSAAATRALKAQFSAAQWATIRDYGFSHPALVPFINEDPMLVMSLIEGLGVRKLNSSDGAHINLNQVLSATDIISYKANGTFSIGGRLGGAGSAGTYTSHSASPYGIRYYTGSWTTLYGNTVQTEIYTCEWDFNTKKCTVKDKGVYNFNYNIVNVNQKIEFGDAGFVKFKIDNTNESRKRDMYPFICQARTADKVSTGVAQAAGTCGMIDLLTGIFYPNANSSGSFTISDSPA